MAGWPVLAQEAEGEKPTFGQEVLTMRDPFRRPRVASGPTVAISDLELHPLHSYLLTGIMTGPNRIRGMVRAPDGKTHFVSESDKIGNRRGVIKQITPTAVVVQETVVNVLGEEELTVTELKIQDREVQ
jgi:Tfp pilus assembly protein PilP